MMGMVFYSSHQTLLLEEVAGNHFKLRLLCQKLKMLIKQADIQLFGYFLQQMVELISYSHIVI